MAIACKTNTKFTKDIYLEFFFLYVLLKNLNVCRNSTFYLTFLTTILYT